MTTPDPTTLLRDVAANVLRVLDGGDPVYIDDALTAYAWAVEQTETGSTMAGVRFALDVYRDRQHPLRRQAMEIRDRVNAEAMRLRLLPPDALRAELERAAGLAMAEAA